MSLVFAGRPQQPWQVTFLPSNSPHRRITGFPLHPSHLSPHHQVTSHPARRQPSRRNIAALVTEAPRQKAVGLIQQLVLVVGHYSLVCLRPGAVAGTPRGRRDCVSVFCFGRPTCIFFSPSRGRRLAGSNEPNPLGYRTYAVLSYFPKIEVPMCFACRWAG